MESELKPVNCGCGGEAIMGIACHVHEDYAFRVECLECKIVTRFYDTKAEAIEAWNKAMSGSGYKTKSVERTAKVKTVEKPNVYKCGECGQYFHSTAWGSPVEYCSRCGAKLDWSGNE